MKRLALTSAVLLGVGAALLAYGLWGPWYSTTPLEASILLSADQEQIFPFQLQTTGNYQLDLFFPESPSNQPVRALLGDYDRQTKGTLELEWTVLEHDRVVEHGSLRDREHIPQVPKYGPVHYTVAYFHAPRGIDYSLHVHSRALLPSDQELHPSLRVRADAFNLYESRLSFQIIGFGLAILAASGLLVGCVSLLITPRYMQHHGPADGI